MQRSPVPSSDPLLCKPRTVIYGMAVAEILAAVLAMAPQVAINRWVVFGLNSLLAQWIILLSMATVCAVQRRHPDMDVSRLLATVPLVVIGVTCVACVLTLWLMPAEAEWITGKPVDFILRCAGIACAVALLGYLVMHGHLHSRRLQERARDAELAALQARVRPHFLFNALNTATALVHQRPDEAEQVLLDLSDLFRAALRGSHSVALQEEIELVRRYLDIEALRFGDRLQVHWQLPEQWPDVQVPALSLQPLAENAIKHGIEPSPNGGDICIRVSEHAGSIVIQVDNSVPDAAEAASRGHNIGLPSATARIEQLTQRRGSVKVAGSNGHFTVTVTLPMAGDPQ